MSNSECDGIFKPKINAPPNWIVRTTDLYSGRNIDAFAGVYRAAEFRSATSPGQTPEQLAKRLSDWKQALQDEAEKQADANAIVDLGLVPDLCAGGRPPDPTIPSLTPEALGNGSVGNAILELVKQQYWDQYCECLPRDATKETCPCQLYVLRFYVKRDGAVPLPKQFGERTLAGRISGIRKIQPNDGGPSRVEFGVNYGLGCPTINNGAGAWFAMVAPSLTDAKDWTAGIVSIAKLDPDDPDTCAVEPPPPENPPYTPGIPGVLGFPLPDPVVPNPDGSLPPVRVPMPFTLPVGKPSNCPPCEECEEPDMYYWKLEKTLPAQLIFSGTVGLSGQRINVPFNAGKIDVRYEPVTALADRNLRNYRRAGAGQGNDDVFIRVAQLFLRGPNDAVVQQKDAVMPLTQFTIPWEDNDSAKSLIILPLGLEQQFQVLDSGYRWVQKKFEKLD